MEDTRATVPARVVSRPTLADVARAAGVNKSTVSRALRGDPMVGLDTRQRIQRLAAQLNYFPNASAKRLTRARTDTLAFAARGLRPAGAGPDPFLVELLSGITDEAALHHFDVLLSRADEDANELNVYARILGGHHADGVIVADLRPNDRRVDYLCARHCPHVLFGRPTHDLASSRRYAYPWVEVDGRTGARVGTQHLVGLGHSRIAFISGGNDFFWETDRLAGYRDALARAGLPFEQRLCVAGGYSQESGYEITLGLLDQPDPPTAIFAISDVLAVGAMRAAQETGRVIGTDFAVMGFDGVGLGAYLTPALTTVRQPTDYVGRMLVRLLVGVLNGEPPPERHILLQPELIVRASTQGPAHA